MASHGGLGLPLRRLRPAPSTPTRHHPPDGKLWFPPRPRMRRSLNPSPSNVRCRRAGRHHPRKAYVSWEGLGCRRLQESWNQLQEKERGADNGSSFPGKPPLDSQMHPALSAQRPSFAPPRLSSRGSGVSLLRSGVLFLAPSAISDGRYRRGEKPSKQEGHPRPSLRQPPREARRCHAIARRPSPPDCASR
jgi:hypothetical protein